ncbi:hypothetical protein [uncultured Prevotella sp.]|uniref:hypothetical protein n=1 Tax=uncultured Prevotella sp. TaxID=159272 RepID=UPI00262A484B|nr:hypothetical protein [uncultured Prevotella sp.]
MTDRIEKDKVLAAVVRTFFKYFTLGIIEAYADDPNDMSVYEPKSVKQFVVKHFEKYSQTFNEEAFYAFSRMNYIEEEVEEELKKFMSDGNVSDMELMRFACRDDEFYSTMVSEYKRNMELLLCGIFSATPEQASQYTRCNSIGNMPQDNAEAVINRIANKAYEKGKKIKEK